MERSLLTQWRSKIWYQLQRYFESLCKTQQNASSHMSCSLKIKKTKIQEILRQMFKDQPKQTVQFLLQNMERLDRSNSGYVTFQQFGNYIIKKYCGELCLQNMHKSGELQHSDIKRINFKDFHRLVSKSVNIKSGGSQSPEIQTQRVKQIFNVLDSDQDQLLTYVQYFQMIDKYLCMNTQQFNQVYLSEGSYSEIVEGPVIISSGLVNKVSFQQSSDKYSEYQKLEDLEQPHIIAKTHPQNLINKQKQQKTNTLQYENLPIDDQQQNSQIQSIQIDNYPEIKGVDVVSSITDGKSIEAIRRYDAGFNKKNHSSDHNENQIAPITAINDQLQQKGQSSHSITVQKPIKNQSISINVINTQGNVAPVSQVSLIDTLVDAYKKSGSSKSNSGSIQALSSINTSSKKFKDSLSNYLGFNIIQKSKQSALSKEQWSIILLIWNQLLTHYKQCSLINSLSVDTNTDKNGEVDIGIDRKGADNLMKIIVPAQLLLQKEREREIIDQIFNSSQPKQYRIYFQQLTRYVLMFMGEKALQKYQKTQVNGNKGIKNQKEFIQIFYKAFGRLINNFYSHQQQISVIYDRIMTRNYNYDSKGETRSELTYRSFLSWVNLSLIRLDC